MPGGGACISIVATTDGQGYWIACSTGGVFNFGNARFFGSVNAATAGLPIVAMAATPDGGGYWLADADGTVFSFGDARHLARFAPVRAASPSWGSRSPPTAPATGWPRRTDGPELRHGGRARLARGPLATSPVTSIAAMPVETVSRSGTRAAASATTSTGPSVPGPGRPKRPLSPARRRIPPAPSTTPSPSSASTDGL